MTQQQKDQRSLVKDRAARQREVRPKRPLPDVGGGDCLISVVVAACPTNGRKRS
jgi:hypothetical protein